MWRWRAALLVLPMFLLACGTSATSPTGFGVSALFTYRTALPASASWPAERCGDTLQDRRPMLILQWTGSRIPMAQDASDPRIWRAQAWMPPNVPVEISVRDPGLCRMTAAPYMTFAWSGVTVNDTPLSVTEVAEDSGAPCFGFRISGGEVVLTVPR